MSKLHPMIVNFPLALILTAAGCLLIGRLTRRDNIASSLDKVGTWNLCLGAAAALVAVGTGMVSAGKVIVSPEAQHSISVHMGWGLCTTVVLVLLSVWRGAGVRASRPNAIFLIVLGAASVALIVTGYYGGQNVYDFGVGVLGDAVK